MFNRHTTLASESSPVVVQGSHPLHVGLRATFFAVAFTYLVWNAWWLSKGQLGPSLLLAATGIPAPTSGGTRSILALIRGDFAGSLQWNAMAIPLSALLVVTLGHVALLAFRGKRISIPRSLAWSWLILLVLAWIAKLVIAEPAA